LPAPRFDRFPQPSLEIAPPSVSTRSYRLARAPRPFQLGFARGDDERSDVHAILRARDVVPRKELHREEMTGPRDRQHEARPDLDTLGIINPTSRGAVPGPRDRSPAPIAARGAWPRGEPLVEQRVELRLRRGRALAAEPRTDEHDRGIAQVAGDPHALARGETWRRSDLPGEDSSGDA
jgi:hypothetical protein